ncbi:MAG: methylated-DNA--[protein]-cysteine S-methyltransferase [Clostridia bacterium]|nr:methylated-DNA--[protein]-cysteine S-methyltransferase [Clostridia bacterium]
MFIEKVQTDIGTLTLTADENALLRVDFGDTGEKVNGNPITQLAKREIELYFEGKLKNFTVPYRLDGTDFQKKVWQALAEIPYGEAVSYQFIAQKIGNPKGCRAVGMANNKNKLPIIVPCHRVVGKNGTLTGYAGGLSIKEKLLEIEKKMR